MGSVQIFKLSLVPLFGFPISIFHEYSLILLFSFLQIIRSVPSGMGMGYRGWNIEMGMEYENGDGTGKKGNNCSAGDKDSWKSNGNFVKSMGLLESCSPLN